MVKRLLQLGVKKDEVHKSILGIEIDPLEARKARATLAELDISNADQIIHTGDFFEYCKLNLIDKQCFQVVIGNPPFLRYQDFPRPIKETAFELMAKAGLRPSGHSNSWVPFLIISSLLLSKDDGILAMIIPAQLFQVSYAADARRFLSSYYKKLTIITFEKLVFQDALQDIVILLGERNNSKKEGIRVVEYRDPADLKLNGAKTQEVWNDKNTLKPLDHTKDKWTQYFLDVNEIFLLRKLREKLHFEDGSEQLGVDIGVVTGKNDYFVLNAKEAEGRRLIPFCTRIVCNSANLQGIQFSMNDLSILNGKASTWLFTPPNRPVSEYPSEVQEYIKNGEMISVNKGYKCSIRKKWYIIPSLWAPDAFMLRQIHQYPKIVLNQTEATCTDTIHRVKILCDKNKGREIISAFLNSMTLAFAEITGRSYGGGVLTLEPSEIERLPIPLNGSEKLDFEKINNLERQGKIEEILEITDLVLLKEGLKMEDTEITMLRNIWKKLKNRRIGKTSRS